MSFRSQMRIRWNHVRDHAGNVRARTGTGTAYRAHVAASNAWYRVAGRRIHATRQQYRNWLNRRAIKHGKSPLPERLARPVTSALPVYRNRINPATGRAHRDDREIGRRADRALARVKTVREAEGARTPYHGRLRGGESDVLRHRQGRSR